MIRTFIALEIDEQVKKKIAALISGLKKPNTDVKWVTENQMHLTMKFLGSIEEDKAEAVSATLKSIGAQITRMETRVKRAFPAAAVQIRERKLGS